MFWHATTTKNSYNSNELYETCNMGNCEHGVHISAGLK